MEPKYEDKYLLKYGALEHDFEQLQEEAEEVTNQLQKAREAKRLLQAEVSFLRRRALLLRERANSKPERISDPYFANDTGGETPSQYAQIATTQVSSGKMISRTKLSKGKNRSVAAGASKSSSSSKQTIANENFPSVKRKGGNKRKISWQDDYSIQV